MFFKSISIKNFRGINNLQIDDIKQFNIFTGKNNCGKTSILEALFLLIGMSNPRLPFSINNFRDLILTEDDDFRFIFNNLNFKNTPLINGMLETHRRQLEITPHIARPKKDNTIEENQLLKDPDVSLATTSTYNQIDGIILQFQRNRDKKLSIEVSMKQDKIKLHKDYKEELNGTYINPRSIMGELNGRFDVLLEKKNLQSIITSLKGIEKNISDIRMGKGNMIYVDIGIEKLIPINLVGDGLRRILSIVTTISDTKNDIVLIDEIENGLHYSSLSTLWKAIIRSAKDNNVQLFIATHSYECIVAFYKMSQEMGLTNNDIRLYRIDKTDNKHKALFYDIDTLGAGIEKSFEVR